MADFETILGGSTPAWLTGAQDSINKGDPAAALTLAEKARDEYRNKGDKKGEGAALVMIANAGIQVGSWDVVSKASSEALHVFQATKDKVGESASLVMVSNACFQAGNFAEAIGTAEDASILAESVGATKQTAYCKKALASSCLALLRTKENLDPDISAKALEAAQEASVGFRGREQKGEMGQVMSDLATAYLISGNVNMALAKAKNAQRLYQADMDVGGEARALLIVAQALQKEGTLDGAMQALEDAAGLFANIGDQNGQVEAYGLMEEYQSLSVQERRDFTQRIMARFDKEESGGAASKHSFSPGGVKPPHFFMPPSQPVPLGLGVVRFTGFMGRAATVVAPRGSSSAAQQNRFLLYNVSWT